MKSFSYQNISILALLGLAAENSVFESNASLHWLMYGIMLLYGLFALYETYKTRQQNHAFLNSSIAFFVLLFFYGVWRSYTAEVYQIVDGYNSYRVQNPNEFLAQIFSSLLPIFIFYKIFSKGGLPNRVVSAICWLLFGIFAVKFYMNSAAVILDLETTTNNVAYELVSLLPLTFVVSRKQWVQLLYLFANLLLIITSIKRGAIIISGVYVIIYLYYGIRNSKGTMKSFQIALSIVVAAVSVYLFLDQFATNSSFANKFIGMSQGDASGRDEMYSYLWNYFFNQNNVTGFVFGHGLDYTIYLIGNLAHQDWLELLIDTGLCGTILYVLWYRSLYKDIKNTSNNLSKYILISCFTIMLLKSMFSMCFYSLGLGLPLALSYALLKNDEVIE